MKAPGEESMSRNITNTDFEHALWERTMDFGKPLSPTAARAILTVSFSEADRQRMHKLAAKARAGTLTPSERHEIDAYERLGCLLDILHSKARRSLKRRRTSS
jgi:hypothetical protein